MARRTIAFIPRTDNFEKFWIFNFETGGPINPVRLSDTCRAKVNTNNLYFIPSAYLYISYDS